MSFSKFDYPSLETERFNLRILSDQDTEAVFEHFSDEEVTRYLDIEPCKDRKEAEEIIRFHLLDSGCRWATFEKGTNQFMGTCGFHCLRRTNEDFIAEVGYDLAKAYWGKGLMEEGLKEVLAFGFATMGLTVIDATVDHKNERSLKLMKKLGFVKEVKPLQKLAYLTLSREIFEELIHVS